MHSFKPVYSQLWTKIDWFFLSNNHGQEELNRSKRVWDTQKGEMEWQSLFSSTRICHEKIKTAKGWRYHNRSVSVQSMTNLGHLFLLQLDIKSKDRHADMLPINKQWMILLLGIKVLSHLVWMIPGQSWFVSELRQTYPTKVKIMGRRSNGQKGSGIPKKGRWNDRIYANVRENVIRRTKQQRVEGIVTEV